MKKYRTHEAAIDLFSRLTDEELAFQRNKEKPAQHNFINRNGTRYGHLVVIRQLSNRLMTNGRYIADWLCLCDCGTLKNISAQSLAKGTISCGCEKKKQLRPGRKPRLPPGVSAKNRTIKGYKRAAQKRGFHWLISDARFFELASGTCYYCGVEPSNVMKPTKGNGDFIYNGIDRIDNKDGYTEGNIVTCCSICNHAKATMSQDKFLAWVRRIALFQSAAIGLAKIMPK